MQKILFFFAGKRSAKCLDGNDEDDDGEDDILPAKRPHTDYAPLRMFLRKLYFNIVLFVCTQNVLL